MSEQDQICYCNQVLLLENWDTPLHKHRRIVSVSIDYPGAVVLQIIQQPTGRLHQGTQRLSKYGPVDEVLHELPEEDETC